MDLETKYVQKFKEAYVKKNKRDITDQEAMEHFLHLVELVRRVYRPIPLSQAKEIARLLSDNTLDNRKRR